MSRDPFELVRDAPLFVVPRMLDQLRGYRAGAKLAGLPGPNPSAERERLASQHATTSPTQREVLCPHCAGSFYVD